MTKGIIITKIKKLKNSEIRNVIDNKIKHFKLIQNSKSEIIFLELCFCLLTANFNAKRAIGIQEKLGTGFITLKQEELVNKLKLLGHRFPNKRAEYIFLARKYKNTIKPILKNFNNDFERREWLINNIKGLGMKESSHFLRNIGYLDVAILDFHIINILYQHSIIEMPKSKSISKKLYLNIEEQLNKIALKLSLNQGELDFYLWYLETNSILK